MSKKKSFDPSIFDVDYEPKHRRVKNMATALTAAADLQLVPIANLIPNVNNPRKHFDKEKLKELAKSIETTGVLEPIVCRKDPMGSKKLEIVFGERRFRASKLAGKTEIPVIIREISDREALEMMVIENQQREDVNPLEEGRGYKALMDLPSDDGKGKAYTVDDLAAKVGKGSGYIYARIKLLALIHPAQQALDQGHITPGHAVLIARLQPAEQIAALLACFRDSVARGQKRPDVTANLIEMIEDWRLDDGCIAEKALREWIQENVNLKLKGVPWDLNDAELLPSAGACSTCQKRSVSNPGLFGDLAIKGADTCFDPECFKQKRQAFVQLEIKKDKEEVTDLERAAKVAGVEPGEKQVDNIRQLSDRHGYTIPRPDQPVLMQGQWLPAKRGSCSSAELGLMVRGENAGEKLWVCCNANCKVHPHKLQRTPRSAGSGPSDYEIEEFRRHKSNITGAKRAISRRVLVREIIDKVGPKMPLALLRALTENHVKTGWSHGVEMTLSLMGMKEANPIAKVKSMIEKGSESVLNKLLIADLLEVSDHADDKKERKELQALAKSVGIKNPHGILTREDDRVNNKVQKCRECGCIEEAPCDWYDSRSGRTVHCSWKEPDLCSNKKCLARAAAAKKAKDEPKTATGKKERKAKA